MRFYTINNNRRCEFSKIKEGNYFSVIETGKIFRRVMYKLHEISDDLMPSNAVSTEGELGYFYDNDVIIPIATKMLK